MNAAGMAPELKTLFKALAAGAGTFAVFIALLFSLGSEASWNGFWLLVGITAVWVVVTVMQVRRRDWVWLLGAWIIVVNLWGLTWLSGGIPSGT